MHPSVAYKNAVGSRRVAWRIITSIEQKEKSKSERKAMCNIKAMEISEDKPTGDKDDAGSEVFCVTVFAADLSEIRVGSAPFADEAAPLDSPQSARNIVKDLKDKIHATEADFGKMKGCHSTTPLVLQSLTVLRFSLLYNDSTSICNL